MAIASQDLTVLKIVSKVKSLETESLSNLIQNLTESSSNHVGKKLEEDLKLTENSLASSRNHVPDTTDKNIESR